MISAGYRPNLLHRPHLISFRVRGMENNRRRAPGLANPLLRGVQLVAISLRHTHPPLPFPNSALASGEKSSRATHLNSLLLPFMRQRELWIRRHRAGELWPWRRCALCTRSLILIFAILCLQFCVRRCSPVLAPNRAAPEFESISGNDFLGINLLQVELHLCKIWEHFLLIWSVFLRISWSLSLLYVALFFVD